ncbi:hypothetical protein CerSpe_295120 [Prunus speciosa]
MPSIQTPPYETLTIPTPMSSLLFLLLLLLLSSSPPPTLSQQNDTVACPLNFEVLRRFNPGSNRPKLDRNTECQYILGGLRLVEAQYLQLTGSFLPPPNASESCWAAYQALASDFVPNFDIRASCGFETSWISQGCMNITTRQQFEDLVGNATLKDVIDNCNQSLGNSSPCASCTTSLSSLQASYLTGKSVGNVSTCTGYPSVYAAAFANQYGPADVGTAQCLFSLNFSQSSGKKKRTVILISLVACGVALLVIIGGVWFLWHKYDQFMIKKRRKDYNDKIEKGLGSALESISGSTTLIKFKYEEISAATKNFSRDNIIGRGGYGNVYKGILDDGSEVAFKRFKNCSAAGDANFAHEVEVIASVRHVNLVALRGYCTATTPLVGHQRIILYARPTMDQVVKMLETDLSVPSIPERPISIVANIEDIERHSSSGSLQLSSSGGYQTYTFESHLPFNPKGDGESSFSGVSTV